MTVSHERTHRRHLQKEHAKQQQRQAAAAAEQAAAEEAAQQALLVPYTPQHLQAALAKVTAAAVK